MPAGSPIELRALVDDAEALLRADLNVGGAECTGARPGRRCADLRSA